MCECFCLYSYTLMRVRSNSYASIAYPSQEENLRAKNKLGWRPPITDVTAVLVANEMCDCSDLAFAWYQFSGEHDDLSKQ